MKFSSRRLTIIKIYGLISKGGVNMAYESKIILASLAHILAKSETVDEAYAALTNIANVEGVILKPIEELRKELSSAKQSKGE
jgi:hypothetical protein